MADTTFVDHSSSTPIVAAWLNDVNDHVYNGTDQFSGGVYNVKSGTYGATGDGTTNDSAAIQEAIDDANAAGGGVVFLPVGTYNLGTTGLTIYQNISLIGETQQYTAYDTRGTIIKYSGSGFGIWGENLLNVVLQDFSMNNDGATGVAHIGIYLQGCWLSTIRRVRVRGSTPAKGYGIRIYTNTGGPTWGAQHNLLEMVECADGIIHFLGTGSGDGVTTTVCNTIRGFRYEIVSSQVVFINSTAEGWTTGAGFDFSGVGCHGLMLGCDIEGTGAVGIGIDGNATVREVGTIWDGYSGALRVNGATSTNRQYGGFTEWIRTVANSTAVALAKYGNGTVNFVTEELYPVEISGGSQDGFRQWKRYIAGTERLTHEWRYNAVRHSTLSIANVATTVVTIAIPNGAGVSVDCVAWGTETAVGVFAHSCDITAANNGGTVTTPVVGNVCESAAGSGAVFTAAASSGNLLIKFNHGNAASTAIKFLFTIRGEFTNITMA